MPIVTELAPTLLGVAILALLATAVLAAYGVPHRWAPTLAILRGAAQLAIISVILAGVITNPVWVALALLVMFAVAASTATHPASRQDATTSGPCGVRAPDAASGSYIDRPRS